MGIALGVRWGWDLGAKDAWDNHYGLLWGLMGDRITLKQWSGPRRDWKKIALLLLELIWYGQKRAPS
jgi:hypothetical protein